MSALLSLGLFLAWLWQCEVVFEGDDLGIFKYSLDLYDALLQGENPFTIRPPAVGAPYPPGVPLVAALHYLGAGGPDLAVALRSTWLWYALTLVGAWWGGRRVAGPVGGALGVALAPLLCVIPDINRGLYAEPAMSSMALLAVVSLDASEDLTRPWAAALAGLAMGVGLLAKWSFAFFLGPVAALYCAKVVWGLPHRRWVGAGLTSLWLLLIGALPLALLNKLPWVAVPALAAPLVSGLALSASAPEHWRRLASLCALGVSVLIVTLPWYGTHLPDLLAFVSQHEQGNFEGGAPLAQGWFLYPVWLPSLAPDTSLQLVLWIGAWITARRGPPVARWSGTALLSGALLLSLIPWRTMRYLSGGVALLLPVGVAVFRDRRWAPLAAAALTLASLVFQQGYTATPWNRLVRSVIPSDRSTVQQGLTLGKDPSWQQMTHNTPDTWALFTPSVRQRILAPAPDRSGRLPMGLFTVVDGLCHAPWVVDLYTSDQCAVTGDPVLGVYSVYMVRRPHTPGGSGRLLGSASTPPAPQRVAMTTTLVASLGELPGSDEGLEELGHGQVWTPSGQCRLTVYASPDTARLCRSARRDDPTTWHGPQVH